jgi:hypothetical protein
MASCSDLQETGRVKDNKREGQLKKLAAQHELTSYINTYGNFFDVRGVEGRTRLRKYFVLSRHF